MLGRGMALGFDVGVVALSLVEVEAIEASCPSMDAADIRLANRLLSFSRRLRRVGTITSSQAGSRVNVERDGGIAARAISNEEK